MGASNSPSNRLDTSLGTIRDSDMTGDEITAVETFVQEFRVSKGSGGERTSVPSDTTRAAYARSVRILSEYADGPVTELDATGMHDTLETAAEERAWSPATHKQYQVGAKTFAEWRGLDTDGWTWVETDNKSSVDGRTVLTPDEFHSIRQNALTMRDRCIIDLLGYTGQRIRVIQTLTIRDVDPEAGVYYLPDTEGLKGAEGKRPLLGARKSVEEWLNMHPTKDPDDCLITAVEDGPGTPGEEIGAEHINRRVRKAADRAEIEKPTNAHAFRHFFATVCKTQYDMDDSTVRFLLGHSESSRIMETTYRHLSDEDHISAAREAFGMDDGEEEAETLTPPVCPTCGTPLAPSMASCPSAGCREVFDPSRAGPSAEGVVKEMNQMDKEERERLAKLLGGE